MMKLITTALTAIIMTLAGSVAQAVGNQELHGNPFTFLFGNHLDTHQEARLNNDGSLKGRLYIYFTGEMDEASGLPVARHPRGPGQHSEECGVDPIDCLVGWEIKAVPADAKFLSHSGVNGDDHPIWMISSRTDIPQPGSYTHFHWITWASTDDRFGIVPNECNVEKAGMLEGTVVTGDLTLDDGSIETTWTDAKVHLEDGAEDLICPGWLLQITAIREFAFKHGGEKTLVYLGVDNATHLNIVTNYAIIPSITSGNDCGGDGCGH